MSSQPRGLFGRLRQAVLVTSHLYARPVGPAERAAFNIPTPYRVRQASDDDLARIAGDLAGELTRDKAELIRSRQTRADMEVFVVVLPSGQVCGYGHTRHGWVDDAFLHFDLGSVPCATHLFDDYIALAHRGHGLQGALIRARLAAACERGARCATIIVSDTNLPSRASVHRAGFEAALRIVTVRWKKRVASRVVGTRMLPPYCPGGRQ